MDCLHAGRCSKAQEVPLRTVLRGYRCAQWTLVDTATSDARESLVLDIGTTAVRAMISVPTPKYEEPRMSDRETRIEELNDKSRPDCRAELKNTIYDASGKGLRAICKIIAPDEKKWNEDDEECQTQAVKKTLRFQKPELIDLLIKIEFPEEAKPKRRRRTAAKKTEVADDTEEKTEEKKPARRRRRTTKKTEGEAPKEETKSSGDGVDMELLVAAVTESLVDAFKPTLDGIAKVVEGLKAENAALKKGQIAIAIGAMGLDEKEAPEEHSELLEMFDLAEG